jgi:membrane-associated protease RseP (regulator of RpoE activity)
MAWTAMLLTLGLVGVTTGSALAQSSRASGRPWIGIYMQDLSSELRDGVNYDGDGVLVSGVVDNSPAERAGLQKRDVIVSINSRSVSDSDELRNLISNARIGQTVAVGIVRDGARRTLSVRLADWPEGESGEDYMVPTPDAARSPRAPSTPRAPSVRRFETNGDGDSFETPDGDVFMLRGMGRGRLGVRIENLSDDLSGYFGVPDGKGVLIMQVMKDTPAERAGIKAGDVIIRVGDRTVEGTDDLTRALRDEEGKVTITVVRKGVRRTFEPELEKGSSDGHTFYWNGDDMKMGDLGDLRGLREKIRSEVDREGLRKGTMRITPVPRLTPLPRIAPAPRASEDSSEELRQLREELRELRRKLEELEKNPRE